MKVAVIGCGAIGGLFLGYLSQIYPDVIGVVREYQKNPLLKEGLFLEGVRGDRNCKVRVNTQLKEKVDLAILATKINDLQEALSANSEYLRDSLALTTQNGIKADYILKAYIPAERILTGIVMFGATFYPPNRIVHNFEGDLIIGNIFSKKIIEYEKIKNLLQKNFKISTTPNIKGAKYLKIFINLNNCIPASLGISMQEAFSDLELAELAIRLNREAYQIIEKSNIELESLPTYPKERLFSLISLDIKQAALVFSKVMTSLSDKPLYGSILQSIKRKRPSEIDYINGEIVNLAQENMMNAPLNERIVEIVHRVEERGAFVNKRDLIVEMADAITA